ncbi:hypothetical protein PMLGA01_040016600 [Plasmodium malariae]|uniref:Uncharacterized protein n=1 Tax=Plasmodium malariae TaxID=5858 RepID=A0A1C3KAT3_PLAMA|nr:hypothetical protein PMLGA01_040016600 [Plasmodium malariae]
MKDLYGSVSSKTRLEFSVLSYNNNVESFNLMPIVNMDKKYVNNENIKGRMQNKSHDEATNPFLVDEENVNSNYFIGRMYCSLAYCDR